MMALLLVLALVGCKAGIDDGLGTTEAFPDSPVFAPQAVIAETGEVFAETPLLLDGSASYDPFGKEISQWSWACSDGSVGEGARYTVAFAEPGEVNCTLEITTEDGRSASATRALVVLERVQPKWTVLVYLSGDNDLEVNAVEDLNEMEVVGSTADVNVVVQLDRSRGYDASEGNWSGARRYLVHQDDDEGTIGSPVLADLGAVDSGDPAVISDFVRWGLENYPADRYALVLWDHGDGWLRSGDSRESKTFSVDEGSGNDISVANGEYVEILAAAHDEIGGSLDLMGFDACLMGGWEIAHETAPYAEVFVASQATEGLDGWAWDVLLGALAEDPDQSTLAFGEEIAASYMASADSGSTLSVTDLEKLSLLNEALDALADAAIAAGSADSLLSAMDEGIDFEWGWGNDHDILTALTTAEEELPALSNEIQAVLAALDEVVYYADGSDEYEGVGGLNLFSPGNNWYDESYFDAPWTASTRWDDLISEATR